MESLEKKSGVSRETASRMRKEVCKLVDEGEYKYYKIKDFFTEFDFLHDFEKVCTFNYCRSFPIYARGVFSESRFLCFFQCKNMPGPFNLCLLYTFFRWSMWSWFFGSQRESHVKCSLQIQNIGAESLGVSKSICLWTYGGKVCSRGRKIHSIFCVVWRSTCAQGLCMWFEEIGR